MKKRILAAICAIVITSALVACGEMPQAPATSEPVESTVSEPTPENNNTSGTETNESDTSSDDVTEKPVISSKPTELDAKHDYIFTEEVEYGEVDMTASSYTHSYTLDIIDDTSAVMKQYYIYSDDSYNMTSYLGEYLQDDNAIVFRYTPADDSSSPESYLFELSGNDVKNVSYTYSDASLQKLAGTYTCPKSEYGPILLEISKIGQPTITLNSGKSYQGSILLVDGKYDLMVNDDGDGITIDWFIYFSGSTFTYEPYFAVDYSLYQGDYTAVGVLGDLDFAVDSNGSVSAYVTIDGRSLYFYGSLFVDTDLQTMTGMYLHNDEGYTLDLTLMFIGSWSEWNYSGYLTTPLGAG